MKKTWLLAFLPLVLVAGGCSVVKKTNPSISNYPVLDSQGNTCVIPAASTSTNKDILPPVSQEEKNKTFTYQDDETGVKLQYPGSCYFNKGVFQCSDFTLSVWITDGDTISSSSPAKVVKEGQTNIKYTFVHNNKIYALMAWYDGENRADLEKVIDKIAKSLTFTR